MMTGFKAIALGTLLAVATAGSAAAQSTWSSYVDSRFGTRIAYPSDVLTDVSLGEEGAVFEGSGARLQVSAAEHDVTGPDELRDRMADIPGYEDVTYSPEGRNWLVVSGYRGTHVFYEKYFIVEGTVQGFAFEYRVADRDLFDPIVEELEDSFRPGRGMAALPAPPEAFDGRGRLADHVDGVRERQAEQRARERERAFEREQRQAERRAREEERALERELRRAEQAFERDRRLAERERERDRPRARAERFRGRDD